MVRSPSAVKLLKSTRAMPLQGPRVLELVFCTAAMTSSGRREMVTSRSRAPEESSRSVIGALEWASWAVTRIPGRSLASSSQRWILSRLKVPFTSLR